MAWLLLRGLRLFLRWCPLRLPVALRHGIANLYRPGNHAASVLVALGIGVMFTLTIYLVQKSLLVEVVGAAPPGSPNVYPDQHHAARAGEPSPRFWNPANDLQTRPRLVPLVPARLLLVDGKPVERDRARPGTPPSLPVTRAR